VQFSDNNYKNRPFTKVVVAPGNRVDLLVKAPGATCATAGGCKTNVIVKNMVDPADLTGPKAAKPLTLFTVNVTGTPVDPNSNGAKFIPNAPTFPAFLKSIADDEVKGTKNIVFASTPPANPPAQPAMHTIDNKKFDGEVGEVVLLNNVEEWKIQNATYGPPIAHPFHIHINPF
jgi:FtsP/CotA-like multicopper oxidase with cupredoxin domain